MSANEPTAEGPEAPKADRMAKARAAKVAKRQDRVAQLEEMVAALSKQLSTALAGGEGALTQKEKELHPGEYFVGGIDAGTGKPVMRKKRWTRSDIERLYPKVTFVPALTVPINPHGVSYDLVAGQIATVPSIVKGIHDQMLLAIRRQSEGYQVTEEQSRRVFDAARRDVFKGRHFTGLEHQGYGWPVEALEMAAKGRTDAKAMAEIGWEPESGFPGGYEGKPLPEPR